MALFLSPDFSLIAVLLLRYCTTVTGARIPLKNHHPFILFKIFLFKISVPEFIRLNILYQNWYRITTDSKSVPDSDLAWFCTKFCYRIFAWCGFGQVWSALFEKTLSVVCLFGRTIFGQILLYTYKITAVFSSLKIPRTITFLCIFHYWSTFKQ